MTAETGDWTHPVALTIAENGDPVEETLERVRELILQAIDAGWEGPPFDPVGLADHLDIKVIPTEDVQDARVVPGQDDSPVIEFNPNRPRGRRRFSLAHEIAHTLLPGHVEQVWHRDRDDAAVREDEWQVEALCNLAAGEILMPVESFDDVDERYLVIENVLKLQETFDVSTEAVLIRLSRVADFPCAVFAASRLDDEENRCAYRVDYWIGSRLWDIELERHSVLPNDSVVSDCTAIGYTAKGEEQWNGTRLRVECVAIPPYPGDRYPRVVGTLRTAQEATSHRQCIQKVMGDAREPRGDSPHIIAHVVNDATENWGGNGFAVALKERWPQTQDDFRNWAEESRKRLELGNVRIDRVDQSVIVASMVAQEGYGPSPTPRIRYEYLRACLSEVANYAESIGASLHMPRIGCGQGGGDWRIVEDIVRETACKHGLQVTVYDLPDDPFDEGQPAHRQLALEGLT